MLSLVLAAIITIISVNAITVNGESPSGKIINFKIAEATSQAPAPQTMEN